MPPQESKSLGSVKSRMRRSNSSSIVFALSHSPLAFIPVPFFFVGSTPTKRFEALLRKEGVTCVEQFIREGINVNVTLLFGLPHYREVAQAYIAGLGSNLSLSASVPVADEKSFRPLTLR